MNDLVPEEWEITELGNVAKVIDPHPSHRAPEEESLGVPFAGIGDLDEYGNLKESKVRRVSANVYDEHIERYKISSNTIGFGRVASIGKIIDFKSFNRPVTISPTMAIVEPYDINKKFLVNTLKSINTKNQINLLLTGSTRSSLGIALLREIKLPLPPLPEQQKIAAILTSVDDVIEKTQAQINKLKDLKTGMMQELLTCGVGVDGKPHTEFKDSPVGRIPKAWDVVPLANFALNQKQSFVNGPFGSDLLSSELTNQGVPVIYVRDMKDKEYKHISKVYVTEEKANNLSACNVIFGDVLVAKVGDPPCNSGVYRSAFRAVVTQDVIRIRPAEVVDSNFLAYLLNSSIGRKQIEKIEVAGTRKRVSLTEFKKLLLPMPTLEEQKMIGSSLLSFDEKLEKLYKKLEKVNYVKKALMQDLLTGKVRVNVD
ncbi:TPA: restriction endonuclease subunit S [Photobacterium damselae]